MPQDQDDVEALKQAEQDAAEGKSSSTQAGEFVREEIHHVREGKHGARSAKQAIAIGLSKARRAGIDLPAPGPGAPEPTRRKAEQDASKGRRHSDAHPSPRRSRAVLSALRHEGKRAASKASLARQARSAARKRGAAKRSASARKAAKTRARGRRG